MAKKTQSRAQAKAASKSRPAATSQASATSSLAALTAYSPTSPHFAILTQAVDRHRLTVYSVSAASGSGKLLVDYVLPVSTGVNSVESARCTAICWVRVPASPSSSSDAPQAKKRKGRKSQGDDEVETPQQATRPVLALGLQSGQVHLFDVAQGKVTRALADANSSSNTSASNSITSLASATTGSSYNLYATAKDGAVRVWNVQEALASATATSSSSSAVQPTQRFSPPSQSTPNTLLSVSPTGVQILVANHSISQLDPASSFSAVKASFTSHATPLTHLTWIDDEYFVSAAKNDPVLYLWRLSRSKSPLGTIELEQGEEVIRVEAKDGVLAIVGSQGYIGLYDVSAFNSSATSTSKTVTLIKARSTSTANDLVDVRLTNAAERMDLARLVKGVKLDLSSTQVKDPATSSILSTLSIPKASQVSLLSASTDDSAQTKGLASVQRYSDATSSAGKQSGAVSSNGVVGEDGMIMRASDGALDRDEALDAEGGGVDDEQTLEDRLRGLKVMRSGQTSSKKSKVKTAGDDEASSSSSADEEDEEEQQTRLNLPNGSLSLATSLSQALHSSDTALTSSLLTSSNPSLIRSTILRLSPPNSVLLLEACITRLNGGVNGNTRKPSSSGKARILIEWIKWTLRLHAGYLMSLPHLTSRLASLHSALSSRLVGNQRMVALQGRLDLVLGQIEIRGQGKGGYEDEEEAERIQGVKKVKGAGKQKVEKKGSVWKEDEEDLDASENEDEMDVDSQEDSEEDDDDSDDDDASSSEAEEVEAAEDEGDIDEVGLTSQISGGALDDSDEEEIRPSRRRQVKAASKSKGSKNAAADVSGVSGGATSDESDEDMDDLDDEDEEEDEEDESDLMDEDDDEEDDEEDSDEEGGANGFLDDEAEEGTEESSEEED